VASKRRVTPDSGQTASVHAYDLIDLVQPGAAVRDKQDGAAFGRGQQVPDQLVGRLLIEVLGRAADGCPGTCVLQAREGCPPTELGILHSQGAFS